jgi:pyruvate formate lyase activating enzyme
MRDAGVWLEITNLVIPGINDDMQMIREMCKCLKNNGLSEAPLHFSRFFPRYKMQDIPPTPRQTLFTAKQIAQEEGIKHVYLGNI